MSDLYPEGIVTRTMSDGRVVDLKGHPVNGYPVFLPTFEQLEALPSLCQAQTCDLRIDTGDFRVWTSRMGLEDGEPFERTVYVEVFSHHHDPESGGTWFRWQDLGHYDGDDPPRGLPGMTPHALRGELGSTR